jgi:hypothetical protein
VEFQGAGTAVSGAFAKDFNARRGVTTTHGHKVWPVDPADGLPAPAVGSWAQEKHLRLQRYIEITRATRRKFLGPGNAGATYIDPYCGAARAHIRGTDNFIDGSPLVAFEAAKVGNSAFTVFISMMKTRPLPRRPSSDSMPEARRSLAHMRAPQHSVARLSRSSTHTRCILCLSTRSAC